MLFRSRFLFSVSLLVSLNDDKEDCKECIVSVYGVGYKVEVD